MSFSALTLACKCKYWLLISVSSETYLSIYKTECIKVTRNHWGHHLNILRNKLAFPWNRTGKKVKKIVYLKHITPISSNWFYAIFYGNLKSCRDGTLPNKDESNPLSPQICLLNSGSSVSQDLAMDRIPTSPLCTWTDHGGNFIFFCRTEVENLLKLCLLTCKHNFFDTGIWFILK